jgi:hypothetical protein
MMLEVKEAIYQVSKPNAEGYGGSGSGDAAY